MQIPRWRNLVTLTNSIVPCLFQSSKSTLFASSFHSTPTSCQRWRGKADPDTRGDQKPSKAQIRIVVRQKRADSKKALKNFLNKYTYQPGMCNWGAERIKSKKSQPKFDRNTGKSDKKKVKNKSDKSRRERFAEDYEYSERVFEAAFGNKRYTWSDWSSDDSSSQHSYEQQTHNGRRQWASWSESESDDESSAVGSYSDRKALDLPLTGPLKIEDVKIAFRLSALKWHPDKHPGPSQEMAEEKFRLCVEAYQSLCKVFGV